MSQRAFFGRVAPILVVGVFVIISFQNCSPAARPSSSINMSGNGTGYGGKVVVAPTDKGILCPDLTNIQQRVEIINSEATLVRDNCQNLPPKDRLALGSVEKFDSSTVNISGKEYQLEALLGNGRGVRAVNKMGVYAPSMVSDLLPSVSFVDGVALGSSHILVVFSQTPASLSAIGKELVLRLYRRDGVSLALKHEIKTPVPTVMALSDLTVLMGTFAFDDTHAVVFTHRASPFGTQAIAIRRVGEELQVTDSTSAFGDMIHIQGHPLPNGKYLLSYLPNETKSLKYLGARVLWLNDEKIQMGPPVILFNPAPQPNGPISLLPVPNQAGRFEAYSANTNYVYLVNQPNFGQPTGLGNLVHWSLRVDGSIVTPLTNPTLTGSTTDLTCCSLDFIGDAATALLSMTAKDGGHAWSAFINGLLSIFSPVEPAQGYYTGTMNMMGAENLRINGRYYFRMPTATGTRIFYLDSINGKEQPYATTFPRFTDHNSSKLFASGDNLVLIETEAAAYSSTSDGHIHVLSTPNP